MIRYQSRKNFLWETFPAVVRKEMASAPCPHVRVAATDEKRADVESPEVPANPFAPSRSGDQGGRFVASAEAGAAFVPPWPGATEAVVKSVIEEKFAAGRMLLHPGEEELLLESAVEGALAGSTLALRVQLQSGRNRLVLLPPERVASARNCARSMALRVLCLKTRRCTGGQSSIRHDHTLFTARPAGVRRYQESHHSEGDRCALSGGGAAAHILGQPQARTTTREPQIPTS